VRLSDCTKVETRFDNADLVQLNLRLNRPNDPFKGSFGQLIVSTPFHCLIRPTLEFFELGDFVGAAGARERRLECWLIMD